MRILFFTIFFSSLLVACSKPGERLLSEMSGVWRSQSGELVTIGSTENGFVFVAGEHDIGVKLGEIDEEQGTVNMNITTTEGKPAIWTLKQVWDKEKKNFSLTLTLHDGTQDELSFVRKVSSDDMAIIERNRKAATASMAPALSTAAVSAVDVAGAQSDATQYSGGPSFDCAKAGTAIEGMICGSPKAAYLDLQLSEAYKRYFGVSDDKVGAKQEQLNWIKTARNICSSVECVIAAYESRIAELETVTGYLSKPAEFR